MLCKVRYCLYENQQLAFYDLYSNNLYTLVARHKTTWSLNAKMAAQHLINDRADIGNAYLYGHLNNLVVMKQPTDSIGKPRNLRKVCLVHKSIYSARQADEYEALFYIKP